MIKYNVPLFIFVLTACIITSACRTIKTPQTGDVYVSMLSATDWQRYHYQFQPTYKLTEEDALKNAVADTAQAERATLDALKLGVQVKLMGGELGATNALNELPGQINPTNLVSGKNLGALLVKDPTSILNAQNLAIDPRLQYQMATALWQEVKMLNRYVIDAAIEKDYMPYIVRLKLSSMPHSTSASYDAYVNLSFSATTQTNETKPDDIKVVPLLINDHLEAALRSNRLEQLRQYVFALSAMFKGIGVGADYESINNQINQSLYRSFNGLMTVGQKNDTDLVVKLGARQTPGRLNAKGNKLGAQYVATEEPRALTVLILVRNPDIPKDICDDKKVANEEKAIDEEKEFQRPGFDTFALNVCYSTELVHPVTGAILANKTIVKTQPKPGFRIPHLDGSVKRDIEYLPRQWIKSAQTAVAFDDGSKTLFTINEAQGIHPNQVQATWFFKEQNKSKVHAISAGRTTFNGEAEQLIFEFPSIKKLHLKNLEPAKVPDFMADKEVFKKVYSSLKADDVVNLPSLASQLQNPKRAFDRWLAGALPQDTKTMLINIDAAKPVTKEQKKPLLKELNKILSCESIYTEERFDEITLRPVTKELMFKNPKDDNLKYFNRLLLEDAYPNSISRSPLEREPTEQSAWHYSEERSFVIELTHSNADETFLFYPWVYATAEQQLLKGFKVSVNRTKLKPDSDGNQTVTIHFTIPEGRELTATFQGADMKLVDQSPKDSAKLAVPHQNQVKISKTSSVDFKLKGLIAESEVTVEFKGPSGYEIPKSLTFKIIK